METNSFGPRRRLLLVRDAGFEPVVVGPLASAKKFDRGTAVYGQALTARELRQRLGIE